MNPYPLLYRLGITPWDRDEVPQPLIDLAEKVATPGRALDLGCGTGRDAVYLAKRGWTVTGIDGVAQALDGARRRSADAGVEVQWRLGDVTDLGSVGLEAGYSLLLDRGCFHGLSDRERDRYVLGASAVAASDAQFLIFAFQPRMALGPRGITEDDLRRRFSANWDVESTTPQSDLKLPFWLGNPRPSWYRLRRNSG